LNLTGFFNVPTKNLQDFVVSTTRSYLILRAGNKQLIFSFGENLACLAPMIVNRGCVASRNSAKASKTADRVIWRAALLSHLCLSVMSCLVTHWRHIRGFWPLDGAGCIGL